MEHMCGAHMCTHAHICMSTCTLAHKLTHAHPDMHMNTHTQYPARFKGSWHRSQEVTKTSCLNLAAVSKTTLQWELLGSRLEPCPPLPCPANPALGWLNQQWTSCCGDVLCAPALTCTEILTFESLLRLMPSHSQARVGCSR